MKKNYTEDQKRILMLGRSENDNYANIDNLNPSRYDSHLMEKVSKARAVIQACKKLAKKRMRVGDPKSTPNPNNRVCYNRDLHLGLNK